MCNPPPVDTARQKAYRAAGWWRTDRTYLDDFLDHVVHQPEQVALTTHSTGEGTVERLSYGRLGPLVDRCAQGLVRAGVEAGDVVSYQLPNGWQFSLLTLACARIGAVVNPLLPIFRKRELQYVLESVGSHVCIAAASIRGHDARPTYAELRREVDTLEQVYFLGAPSDDESGFEAHLLEQPAADPVDLDELRPPPDAIAQIQFTSGTTGAPKGVLHTYNTLYAAYRSTSEALGLTSDDVVLTPSTLAHQTAFLSGTVMVLGEGMTAVYLDAWDPHLALQAIESEGVTFASGATPFMIDLCEASDQRSHDISTLRYFKSGGAAVPQAVKRRVRELTGARVVMAWGMTENGVCTITRPDVDEDLDQGDGTPLPWVELKVTDRDGTLLPAGREGKLWVRSASQCIGYLPDMQLYLEALDEEGWFDTGDLAELRPDGSLRVTGRIKDMIIRGGENIPVMEVEAALHRHPSVAEAVVVGVPDERLGERACAVVVTAQGQEDLRFEEMQAHLDDLNMAKPYWPERLEIVDSLPRTASGKIRKPDVRAHLAADS